MQVKAQAKYIRIAPRKARLVVDLICGLDANKALEQLAFISKKAAKPIIKLINSALANAEHNFDLDKNNLYIKSLTVDDGPTYYRWLPRAHGRATPLRKRTSHFQLILEEKVASKVAKKPSKVKTKAVSQVSRQTVKDEPKPESKLIEDKKISQEVKQPQAEEPFDVRMQGKHRHQEHQDKKNLKDKGFFKKMFRRKSGQ